MTEKPRRPQLPADQVQRLKDAIEERSEISAVRPRQWIASLSHTAQELTKGSLDPSHATVFWVRLFGALDELTRYYANGLDLAGPPPTVGLAALTYPVHQALGQLRALFTEDELIYIEYRRDTEAHVWQKGYELRGHVDQKALIEDREFKLLGSRIRCDEFSRRARALIRSYVAQGFPMNEIYIAAEFARRSSAQIHAIATALEPLYEI
jgi:hypothetical protein